MPTLHDPEPPAHELTCARCRHGYPQHAQPGGGHCLWWDVGTGDHCHCPVFTYVLLSGVSTPS